MTYPKQGESTHVINIRVENISTLLNVAQDIPAISQISQNNTPQQFRVSHSSWKCLPMIVVPDFHLTEVSTVLETDAENFSIKSRWRNNANAVKVWQKIGR